MDDGKAHTAAELKDSAEISRIGHVSRTLNWMVKYGFAVERKGLHKLTLKGREAARNLDDGYDYVPG
ncbi:hypothetical protein [Nocardia sp. BMG51109]|uniref:hypothetical protein n=1 Tax=Nocardia sp. BMG51109 TaxID=1056816 RepID=UPI0012EC5EA9|nr:hypothetical protein [Nocardia sp. BMG51109]